MSISKRGGWTGRGPAIAALVLVLGFVAGIASCARNPVTGKPQLALVSEQQEIQMGKEGDVQVRAQYGVYNDPQMSQYVQAIGQKLVPHTPRRNLPYSFTVLDSPVVNAFSLPGGPVYVTRGIMAVMDSEAELAGVLGHELGHIEARHAVEQVSQQELFQAGLAIGSAVSPTFARLAGVTNIGAQLLFLKFSRSDESQADQLGVQYERAAGYDPAALVSFFTSLEKIGDMSGQAPLPGFLQTHPLTADRIKAVDAMLQPGDKSLAIDKPQYLQRIDGIVYGDDPRQGYIQGNTFYHPALRFEFSFPGGWKAQNTATQVQVVSPDQNAAIVLQAEQSSEALGSYAQKRAAQDLQGATLAGQRNETVNGMEAMEQVFQIPASAQNPPIEVDRTYIRKGGDIYTFTALAAQQNYGSYQAAFGQTVGSFNALTDQAKINVSPQILHLAAADGRRTLQDLFAADNAARKLWPTLAVMNESSLTAVPPSGSMIKIVREGGPVTGGE